MKPQNLPETLVWYYIVGTYVIYFLGAQYVCAPLLATILTIYLLKKWWEQSDDSPAEEKITISLSVWVWIVSMLVMEVALIMGHLDFDLGLSKIINSSLTWYRRWALLALFPLAGHLNIRPALIYRAICILCLQSLLLIPVGYLASVIHLPYHLYTSPLKVLGGGSFYTVTPLYQIDEDNGQPRLVLFAPWAPALGLVANIYLCLARQEFNKKWRWIGITGSIAMIVCSVSRLALLCIPIVPSLVWFLSNFTRPWVQFATGLVSFLAGMFAPGMINVLQTFKEQFSKARASSSEVRKILGRLALYRWETEAPLWGHGIIEPRGPKVAENMPIGSHHTWYGVLFLHGLVGLIALSIPLIWSFVDLLIKAQNSPNARVALSILIILMLFTFAENLETLAYIYWPGLLMLGIAFRDKVFISPEKR